jgi:hypothetical protein
MQVNLTSDSKANTLFPSLLNNAAASFAADKLRLVIATLIPLLNKVCAMPNPIPLVPPVI